MISLQSPVYDALEKMLFANESPYVAIGEHLYYIDARGFQSGSLRYTKFGIATGVGEHSVSHYFSRNDKLGLMIKLCEGISTKLPPLYATVTETPHWLEFMS